MYDYYSSVAASSLWSLLLEASYSITENGAALARHIARGSEIIKSATEEDEDGVAIQRPSGPATHLLRTTTRRVRLLVVVVGFDSMEPTPIV